MTRSIWLALVVAAAVAASWWYWPRNSPAESASTVFTTRHRLAPEGTLFLLDGVSVKTPFGIDGLSPGTMVHKVKQNGTHLTVTDGQHEISVEERQVTNDLDRVEIVRRTYMAAQKAATADIAEQEKAYAKQQDLQAKMLDAQEKEAARRKQAQNRQPLGSGNALNRGAYHQTDAHHYEYDWYGRRYWTDSLGQRHYAAPGTP